MSELTNVYMMGKEERGKLNIFVVSILAPEISHNKQQNHNRDSYTYTVSIAADNWKPYVIK